MNPRYVVPTDPSVVHTWAERYTETHGIPPFAGGEAQAPAAPAAAPAAPAAPAGAPAAPTQAPAAPAAPEGAPQAPAAEPMPDYAKQLLERMDSLAPPAQVDPLAVELGLAPMPSQPLPGQPGFDPYAQQGQAAGQPQPGGFQQPGQAALPGQAQPAGVPGQPVDEQTQYVNQLIDDRAAAIAERMLHERVTPYFQQNEMNRRRTEGQGLVEDYPVLRDPGASSALVEQAKAWGQEVLGNPAVAAEPGFLELTYLAQKGLEAHQKEVAAAAAAGGAGGGEVPVEGAGAAAPGTAVTPATQAAQDIKAAKAGGGLSSAWI